MNRAARLMPRLSAWDSRLSQSQPGFSSACFSSTSPNSHIKREVFISPLLMLSLSLRAASSNELEEAALVVVVFFLGGHGFCLSVCCDSAKCIVMSAFLYIRTVPRRFCVS